MTNLLPKLKMLSLIFVSLLIVPIISFAYCGDGIIDSGEICDGTNLRGQACSLGRPLKCTSDCLSFDYSACLNLDTTPAPTCTAPLTNYNYLSGFDSTDTVANLIRTGGIVKLNSVIDQVIDKYRNEKFQIPNSMKALLGNCSWWGSMNGLESYCVVYRLGKGMYGSDKDNLLTELSCNNYQSRKAMMLQALNDGFCCDVTAPTVSCSDTDGGIVYNQFGVIDYKLIDSDNNTVFATTTQDFCDSNVLREYYCDLNNNIQSENYTCLAGCQDGVCRNTRNPDPIPSIKTCLDSDEGLAYNLLGTVNFKETDLMGRIKKISSNTDTCVGDNLQEFYCDLDKNVQSENHYCYYGCADGACKPIPVAPTKTCTDSDGGRDYVKFGTTTVEIINSDGSLIDSNTNTDQCNGNKLQEYYCDTDNNSQVEEHLCSDGCLDGACQESKVSDPIDPIITCVDSDGGLNYNSQGTTSYKEYDSKGGLLIASSSVDFCVGANLQEYYCDTNKIIKSENHVCTNGCEAGICKQGSSDGGGSSGGGGGGGASGGGESSGGGTNPGSGVDSGTSVAPIINQPNKNPVAGSGQKAEVVAGANSGPVILKLKRSLTEVEKKVLALEIANTGTINQDLVNRLKGRLLLQTEANGEVWFIHPASGERFYVENGLAAYEILSITGKGITGTNLIRIPLGYDARLNEGLLDTDNDGLADVLEQAVGTDPTKIDTDGDGFNDTDEVKTGLFQPGQAGIQYPISEAFSKKLKGIYLDVGLRGEAWYVNPVDYKRYYISPQNAYNAMKYLSLGISNDNLRQIPVGKVLGAGDKPN